MTDGLLLLHAWPIDARMWEPQLAGLPAGLPVATPDLPGFGGSEPAGDVLTMGLAAERAIGAMGERGIDRVVVCGLSMGGYVAFEVWRRARDRVLGLGSPLVTGVRGRGLLLGVALVEPVAQQVSDAALAHGLIVNAANDSTIRLAPPLIIGEREVDEFITRFAGALDAAAAN